jgi:hypothetical protein
LTLTVLTILLFALASLLFAISAGLLLVANNRLRKATHMLKEIDEIMQDIQFALHKKAKITNELQNLRNKKMRCCMFLNQTNRCKYKAEKCFLDRLGCYVCGCGKN